MYVFRAFGSYRWNAERSTEGGASRPNARVVRIDRSRNAGGAHQQIVDRAAEPDYCLFDRGQGEPGWSSGPVYFRGADFGTGQGEYRYHHPLLHAEFIRETSWAILIICPGGVGGRYSVKTTAHFWKIMYTQSALNGTQ